MMQEEKQRGDAAADLLGQFLDAGYVQQEKDGVFIVPGVSQARKFKPFEDG